MPSAVTPSGDGQSLTRCILVIAVSFLRYTETSSVHLKINGGTTTGTKPKQGKKEGRKEGREEGRKGGRKAGKRKRCQSVRRQFEKSGTERGGGEKLG